MHKWKRSFPLLLLLCIAGCAVNGSGLVKVRHYENGTAYVVSWEAWGGHLVTDSMDAGLTLGYSKRTYIYPKLSSRQKGNAESWNIPLMLTGHEVTEVDGKQAMGPSAVTDMVALASKVVGVSLALNRTKVGLAFGVQAREMIWLPRDFDGIVFLKHNLKNDGDTKIYVTGGD
jgi:hypothetical protein